MKHFCRTSAGGWYGGEVEGGWTRGKVKETDLVGTLVRRGDRRAPPAKTLENSEAPRKPATHNSLVWSHYERYQP